MKAKDLMIDDWVMCKKKQSHFQIKRISAKWVMDKDGCYSNFVDIKPIPLTTEILQRNGFVLNDDLSHDEFESFVIDKLGTKECYEIVIDWVDSFDNGASDAFNQISWKECWKLHCMCGPKSFEIDGADTIYVHELQHALRLCGINKKIEL